MYHNGFSNCNKGVCLNILFIFMGIYGESVGPSCKYDSILSQCECTGRHYCRVRHRFFQWVIFFLNTLKRSLYLKCIFENQLTLLNLFKNGYKKKIQRIYDLKQVEKKSGRRKLYFSRHRRFSFTGIRSFVTRHLPYCKSIKFFSKKRSTLECAIENNEINHVKCKFFGNENRLKNCLQYWTYVSIVSKYECTQRKNNIVW